MRDQLVTSGELVLGLVSSPEVGAAWEAPSALPKMSTGALAAHLGSQILTAHGALLHEQEADGKPVIPVVDHYGRAAWTRAGIDDESNVSIRDNAEADAGAGQADVVRQVEESLDALRTATEIPSLASVPWWPYAMTFDDFALTRLLEMVVHTDDLACSLGVETPEFPAEVFDPVLALLAGAASRRHGQTALVRALSRAERAPAAISAL